MLRWETRGHVMYLPAGVLAHGLAHGIHRQVAVTRVEILVTIVGVPLEFREPFVYNTHGGDDFLFLSVFLEIDPDNRRELQNHAVHRPDLMQAPGEKIRHLVVWVLIGLRASCSRPIAMMTMHRHDILGVVSPEMTFPLALDFALARTRCGEFAEKRVLFLQELSNCLDFCPSLGLCHLLSPGEM